MILSLFHREDQHKAPQVLQLAPQSQGENGLNYVSICEKCYQYYGGLQKMAWDKLLDVYANLRHNGPRLRKKNLSLVVQLVYLV